VGSLTLGLGGCAWHLEEEPVSYPSADAVTLDRDAAAQREQDILDVAGTDDSVLGSIESTAAPVHLDALGGVYVASTSSSPSPSPFAGSVDSAVEQARDGALETAQSVEDPDLAFLLSSIGLDHALYLWWSTDGDLAETPEPTASATPSAAAGSNNTDSNNVVEPEVTGEATPDATSTPEASPSAEPVTAVERTLPTSVDLGDAFTPAGATLSPVTFGDLALAHDKARFMYELIAARSAGAERDNALARRDIHAARAAAFVTLAGDQDRRQTLYDIPAANVVDAQSRATLARDTEFALGATYAAMLDGVEPDNRGWISNAAFDAYAAGTLQSGFTASQFPVLPGLTPES
jgi:hypothetical protein